MSKPVKKKQILALQIESLAFGGKGVAKIDDYVIFVRHTVPGQIVKARVTKATASYGEAKVIEIIQKSDIESSPDCPYFEFCGGCSLQNLPYEKQIEIFLQQIIDLYQRIGNFKEVSINTPIQSEKQYNYRNKMEFAFSDSRWVTGDFESHKPSDFALGLRAPGNYWKAVDLENCLIAPKESGQALQIIRNFAIKNKLTAYNQKKHTGFLRHLVIKKGEMTDQIMLNIVTNENSPEKLEPVVKELKEAIPNLVSVVNSVTKNFSGTTIGERENLLFGKPYIEEHLGKLKFRISPASFFQTNTRMAKKLYDIILEFANLKQSDIAWDLYCGTGTIALYLAPYLEKIIGLEIIPAAIRDAKKNAEFNKIDNGIFYEANLDKICRKNPEFFTNLPQPDLIIVDPPRAGIHPDITKTIITISPNRIIYVSCNPSTQVRDLKILTEEGGYKIIEVQPIDMFPHTPHIEIVTKLEKK